jgi:ABC-2 type transport system ATP-binding protein
MFAPIGEPITMADKNSFKAINSRTEILLVEDLRKSYGARPALRNLSFSLRAGRVVGFLGPNGAGKTTAIRILTTILQPDSGYFFIDGISSEYPEKIRQKIGVLPESLGFSKQMTGYEFLVHFGELYGLSQNKAKVYAKELLEEVGLKQRGNSLIGTYSRGMRQRLGIARALINDPVVVFLDEPTLGLDPHGQQELLALVRRVAEERNAGVVLCSHLLSEIEGICDDVVILNLGQVVAAGSVAEVVGRVQRNIVLNNSFRVQVSASMVIEAQSVLRELPEVLEATSQGEMDGWLRVKLLDGSNGNLHRDGQINNKVLKALINAKVPIMNFETEGGHLQDVFLRLTEEVIE